MEGGPQFDVPVGNTGNSQPGGASGWQGMTIKDILEKVDLFNVTSMVDDGYQKMKDTKAPLVTMHNAKVINNSALIPKFRINGVLLFSPITYFDAAITIL
jgi:hypothetical protein